VAYRTDINARDKSGAIVAAIAIQAVLLYTFMNLSGKMELPGPQSVLRVFDLTNPPPPPPPPPAQRQQAKPKEKQGASSPRNIKSEATPVVAPKPQIVTPPVQKIVATEIPRTGTGPTQGSSNVPGPGTGAGGIGTGTGSGAGGNGAGGGGEGAVEPPHLVTPVLSGRDLPRGLIDQWPRGATVFLRLRVDARGYVSECTVDRGTGIAAIDGVLCNLAYERLRFRPALNRSGQAVAGWFGYAQPAPR
jgi:protein TonB